MITTAPHDYKSAHKLVKKLHGSVSTHFCVDCGAQAQHWAFDHRSDPAHHRIGVTPTRGRESLLYYSVDPWSYLSMCSDCHKRFDAAMRKQRRSVGISTPGSGENSSVDYTAPRRDHTKPEHRRRKLTAAEISGIRAERANVAAVIYGPDSPYYDPNFLATGAGIDS